MAHIFTQIPLDIDPVPILGTIIASSANTIPPPHPIRIDRQMLITDLEDSTDGRCNFAALNRLKALLSHGFYNEANSESATPRVLWLGIVTELVVAIHNSIRRSHGLDPKPGAFNDLDREESSLHGLLNESIDSLYTFFTEYKSHPDDWNICLRCLEQCNQPVDAAHYKSVMMSCDQNIRAAHHTIVNNAVRTLAQNAASWSETQFAAIKESLIQGIVAEDGGPLIDNADARLLTWLRTNSHNLREHAKGILLDETVEHYMVPWATEHLDDAKGKLLTVAEEHSSDLVRRKRVEAEVQANNDGHRFYEETLSNLKTEYKARAEADAYAFYQEELARLKMANKDQVDSEYAAFAHQLKIDTAERKGKARAAADKTVTAIGRSSAKANKVKVRHDPIQRRSRPPSAASSPSLSSIDLPTPTTPEAAVSALMDSAPIDTTPKASELRESAMLTTPTPPLGDPNPPHDLASILDSIRATIATESRVQAERMQMSIEGQISKALAPLTSRLNALEEQNVGGNNSWGQEENAVLREYDETDAVQDDDMTYVPPFIDTIYRRLYQVPTDSFITHEYHIQGRAAMADFFDLHFSRNHAIEIDARAEHLPPAIETDFIRDYKAYREPAGTDVRGPAKAARFDTLGPTPAPIRVREDGKMAGRPDARPRKRNPLVHPAAAVSDDFRMTDADFPAPNMPSYGSSITQPPPDADIPANGWITVPQKGTKISFATAAAKPASTASAAAPTTPPSTMDLQRSDFDKMTKEQVRLAYNLRFNANMSGKNHTKESIAAAYIAKANAAPKPAPKPKVPKIIQTTEFTVIRDPRTIGLAKVSARTKDSASIVRQLQQAIRSAYAGRKPPADLIGGRWSSQTSSNFVLTFSGQPENSAVTQMRSIFFDMFGSDCVIAPQRGYVRLVLNGVPIVHDGDGALPTPDELREELGHNPICAGMTLFSDPRWLRSDIPAEARHSSITFAFLDPEGTRTSQILKAPIYMYGGACYARKFSSLPLLKQCERCWRLGHDVSRCNRPSSLLVCPICGGAHKMADHQFACSKVNKHTSLKCSCPRKCINCLRERRPNDGHIATDHSCPLRKKFRSADTRTGDTTDEEGPALALMDADDTDLPLTIHNV